MYKAFLEELQFHRFLVVADVQKIFANLSELVEVRVVFRCLVHQITSAFLAEHNNRFRFVQIV